MRSTSASRTATRRAPLSKGSGRRPVADAENSNGNRPHAAPRRTLDDDGPDRLEPQPGPQTAFLASDADICIYGGAAFGGKTYGLLLELAKWTQLPEFKGVIFRRTAPELTQEGGIWDESLKLYPRLGGVSQSQKLRWRFPSGATIGFKTCQYEQDVTAHKGLQADVIEFDQVEDFTERQFFYLISRNRGSSGINSYIRGTANPQPGWLARFLGWWIDDRTGYPIPERDGVKRWFVRVDDEIYWSNRAESLRREFADVPDLRPRSVTFIRAVAEDNPIGLERNPGYIGGLQSMRRVDVERLRHGNWKIRDDDGAEWPAEYFLDVYAEPEEWPHGFDLSVIAVDGSEGKGDPSAIVFLGLHGGLLYCDAHIEKLPVPAMLGAAFDMAVAHAPQEITFEGDQFQKLLVGDFERYVVKQGAMPWPVGFTLTRGVKKVDRIRRLGGYLKGNRIRFRRGSPGVETLLDQLRRFGLGGHDDGPDALEMGIRRMNEIANGRIANSSGDSQLSDSYEADAEYQ